MKKKFLTFLLAISMATGASAQLAQYHIGSAGHELATLIRPLPDGSSIVAGYNYQLSGNNMQNADIIFTRISAGGNIMWQRQFGQANTNDLVLDMIIAANGDIVAVGTVGRNNVFSNNNGFVFRLNQNTGVLLNSAYIRATPATTAGEYYSGVCELANGNILAVGAYNAASGTSDGLISLFSPTLANIYHERRVVNNGQTDAFQNVVANGNEAFICGYIAAGTFHDVTICSYRPGTGSGTMNWIRSYAYSHLDVGGINLTNNFGGRISMINNRLIVNTNSLNTWSPTQVTRGKHFILRCDLQGNNPDVHLMSNTTQFFTNSSPSFPITESEILYSENPGPNQYQPELIGNVNPYDAVISHVTNMPASTFAFTRNVTQPGTQSVVDLAAANNRYYFVGGSSGLPNAGGNDMYYIVSGQTLQDPTGECPVENLNNATTLRPVTSVIPTTTSAIIDNGAAIDIIQGDPRLISRLICGDTTPPPPSCELQCYWRIDGNNAINSSNFLGTINTEDLRFRTDNTEVGIFETDGDFGINLNPGNPGTAKLHVFCDLAEQHDILGHSNVRFEELMEGKGTILVIDDQGYVYKTNMEVAGKQAMNEMQNELNSLREEIASLKQMLGASADATANANKMTVSPNPTNGDINVSYSVAQPYKSGSIKVTDMSGRAILNIPLDGNTQGTAKLSLPANIASGELICSLVCDGNVVGIQKVTLIRK